MVLVDNSFVQETFVGLNDDDRHCNDCLNKGDEPGINVVAEVEGEEAHIRNTIGEGNGNSTVNKNNVVNAEVTGVVIEEVNGVVNAEGSGVVIVEVNGVVNEEVNTVLDREVIADQDGMSKSGRCVDQMGGPGVQNNNVGGVSLEGGCENEMGLHETKKRRVKIGLVKTKKRGKKRKKKEKEAQGIVQALGEEENQFTEPEVEPQQSVTQVPEGVVRNPFNHFQPSSSASGSVKSGGVNSQVESVGDSGIMMGNNRFELEMERVKSKKLWRIAKDKLGVSADDNEYEIFIERLRAMEGRDKIAKSKKGKTNRSR